MNLLAFLPAEWDLAKTTITLIAVLGVASLDLIERVKNRNGHYLFACILGTLLSAGFIEFVQTLLSAPAKGNAFLMALGIVLLLIGWRLMFGPWETSTKATVLGTFVFWVTLHMLWKETPDQRIAHVIAIGVALIPAAVWCALFLGYHRERISEVLLMFFAGMLSTVPILFYDALARRGIELNFFLFKVTPVSFGRSTEAFVSFHLQSLTPLGRSLITVFLSFVIVGLIEELSKYWVFKKSGEKFLTSIDDAMQFAIIVAIGFAFAENIANQGYFPAFVRDFLLVPEQKDWAGFFGNVMGRSILTSMVHIVSTGVMGYFFGLALFAGPYLQEASARGKQFRMVEYVHDVLRLQTKSIFRTQMLLTGLVLAILLHALSNFLVTLPDVLPGNPRTVGDLLSSARGSWSHYISLLLVPALLYVVGGFWLLTELFMRKENMKERGHVIATDSIRLRPSRGFPRRPTGFEGQVGGQATWMLSFCLRRRWSDPPERSDRSDRAGSPELAPEKRVQSLLWGSYQ
ncbi:PrsW family intramembrane metalloprotease [Candidatus Peregrinibacteria bacterium]|nr:PrsW family intramembrane metalloprotease [Candidatus Peregrinibacteria bacterium]